ncbi:hypothetical protein V474_23480 [Novosphingobium barchaimii LL02]|uniref:Uncharacterized protein n=1 Tax=Novosphingobium barchaimii LL02 TaxID=1114963 RepID=A0A0J7XLR0_9SPHN|nr:hypothetical protein V474_23480 [Novosphingobium barchaimii LL02]
MSIEFSTGIGHAQSTHLFRQSLAAATVHTTGFAFYLMESQWLAICNRRLNYIGTGKRVKLKIEKFRVFGARLRIPNVSTHSSNHFFVKVPHQAFEYHQSFVRNRRTYRASKIALTQKGLRCGKKVGVQDITRISAAFYFARSSRKIGGDRDHFGRRPLKNSVGIIKRAQQLRPTGQVRCRQSDPTFRRTSAIKGSSEQRLKVGNGKVCNCLNRLLVELRRNINRHS